MSDTVTFTLDGREITAASNQTIWEVSKGQGFVIPHLCHKDQIGYRSDGNCRMCMVEVKGERNLVASCIRTPTEGMVVETQSYRAKTARKMVMELLIADQPDQENAHDKSSHLWKIAQETDVSESRFPKRAEDTVPLLDDSHVAMSVNLDACIQCGLCVRACREVQVNDVIGMSGRGHNAYPAFDLNDPMGDSSCVACGECVQACPTGALMPSSITYADGVGDSDDFDDAVESVCAFCGVGCQISIKVKNGEIKYVEGINGPANEGRLCVKGRFGYEYIHHNHRLTKPLIRREDAPAKGLNVDPNNWQKYFREASWDEALDFAANGMKGRGSEVAGFGSAKCTNEEAYLFQKMIRQGFGHNNVDHCTRLCHASSVAALIENIGSGAVTATFNEIENADVAIVIGANPTNAHPVTGAKIKQQVMKGKKLIVLDPITTELAKLADYHIKLRPGTNVAVLNMMLHFIIKSKTRFKDYFSWHEFDNYLNQIKIGQWDRTPQLQVVDDKGGKWCKKKSTPPKTREELLEMWKNGHSFILTISEFLNKQMWQQCQEFEKHYGVGQANIYCSNQKHAKTFSIHADSTDNFLFHVRGKIRWYIYKEFHNKGMPYRPDSTTLLDSFVLDEGDLLYIPKGQFHRVETLSPRISISFHFQERGDKPFIRKDWYDWKP